MARPPHDQGTGASGGNGAARELEGLEDDALMALVATGRRDAFRVLIERHQSWVLGHCVRYLGNRAEAEEAAQEAFLGLWNTAPRYEGRNTFRAYMFTLVINRCRTVERSGSRSRRKHAALGMEPGPSEVPSPQEQLLGDERRRVVLGHLASFSGATREQLILRFVHGLPIEEIAKLSGEPSGTVRSRISRAVAQLRQVLGEAEP